MATICSLFTADATHVVTLELPFPPSINHYYYNTRGGGKRIGAKGNQFRACVMAHVKTGYPGHETLTGRLRVWVECHVPDRRRRDLDNIKKALLDALTHAGIYDDDSQIDDLRSVRCPKFKGGKVLVHIYELKEQEK